MPTPFHSLVDQKPTIHPKEEIQARQSPAEAYRGAPVMGSKIVGANFFFPTDEAADQINCVSEFGAFVTSGLGIQTHAWVIWSAFDDPIDINAGNFIGVAGFDIQGFNGSNFWSIEVHSSDTTTGKRYTTHTQDAILNLFSGIPADPSPPTNGPEFSLQFDHWDGTAVLFANPLLTFDRAGSNDLRWAGIHRMPDLYKAVSLVQGGTGTVTWPGAANFSNTLAVTFTTAFSGTPAGVGTSSGNNTANGQASFYLATAVSTTGFTMRASNWQLQPALNAVTTGNYVAARGG